YTCQCVVTKSAQSCMTNDPKQRPMFASFDGVYNTVLFALIGIVYSNFANQYKDVGSYASTEFFHAIWLLTAIVSAVFTAIAVFSIAPKDRPEFFGTGKPVKVGLKDYWETLKGNRAIQMLVVSASTDKLGASARTSAVSVAMFACIAGSTLLQGKVNAVTTIPSCIITFAAISILATRLGQRKAMLVGSIGGLITNALLAALWLFGDPTTMTSDPATGALNWGFFLTAYVVLVVIYSGFQGISGNIVIPMTADCADYEVYRTGKYVPGLMGTLFSFVDKMVSSFAPMIAGIVFSMVGFKDHNPIEGDPVTRELLIGVVFLAYGVISIGLICNLIAMKFYPLTKEKMEEIQAEVAAIKAKAAQEA
ncbi:MAG: MFS transporter, partial [Evtepia sp.]